MAHSAVPTTAAPLAVAPISLSALAPWALFVGVLMMVLLYLVGAEQGATAIFEGDTIHEWMHDGRHLLGFPCH
ncbi:MULTISPECIES: CbtB-domain containing protein [unclassified Streptomyces]|uniref:CbtB domain-containing protein n=1 Tax=Streptomyces TaxID=1883 RepID=UPI000DC7C004|nr:MULTISPECIES: CbtB-domain containing protein [unclassified Streptomyces]AWZ06345.1 CbtB-domain containing protein [Streptomyces sp. ICC4]AWZ14615.1 CbtB-domain containing protein [Streptomyces sp. ICC1]